MWTKIILLPPFLHPGVNGPLHKLIGFPAQHNIINYNITVPSRWLLELHGSILSQKILVCHPIQLRPGS